MRDGRIALEAGVRLVLEQGSVYEITGEPIGQGGGSILYPAVRMIRSGEKLIPDGFSYALKECYPADITGRFVRNGQGEIVPRSDWPEDLAYLENCRERLRNEEALTKRIYKTAFRILPIQETSDRITLSRPGKPEVQIANTVTVMESLTEKGRSLASWMKERRSIPPEETFRIIRQLLFALKEVHEAGYLHLDIQDGNVFLKGALEDKSEFVTLIDFGSAREMKDGKTPAIADRIIFTTPGFSAPEILTRNDGTLQLKPAADLYSVGCLALYLLTGQRPDSRLLMANRTGLYIKPNQLRRIKCPKHLAGKMQRILGKALAKDPDARYASVDKMLEDVTDLIHALQPAQADLGANAYDAFICYKHGDVDSTVALALQRMIENYRAPRDVCEKRKPFERVFVDEGELSSCANFEQQIRAALKNTGWLIVLCSPGTPLSPWVQAEIDIFLEYHDRSRILAVLTGGDEKISFPPQLKESADGGAVLAADARGENAAEVIRKLRKDPLLKLVAPMLGIRFDDLKQRQKLYRMQNTAAACAGLLTVTAVFAAYAINRGNVIAEQAIRIETEYQRAMVNESLFLTEQAEKQLKANDVMAAMELALQALPSETRDRPALTQTEYLLGKTLGIYKTTEDARNTVATAGTIHTELPGFCTAASGERIFLWDDWVDLGDSILQSWDTRSLTMLWERRMEWSMKGDPVLSQDRVYLMSREGITCMDARNGSITWETALADSFYMTLSEDEGTLLVISGERGNQFAPEAPQTQPHTLQITCLSAHTGEVQNRISVAVDGTQYICDNICVSPDLKWAAIPTQDEGYDKFPFYPYHSLYLADLQTGKCRMILDSRTQIHAMEFTEGRLALIRSSGHTWLADGNTVSYFGNTYSYWSELYDVGTGSRLWEIPYTGYVDIFGIHQIRKTAYTAGNQTKTGLLFLYENRCDLADLETGAVIRSYTLPAAALWMEAKENGIHFVSRDGSYSITGQQGNVQSLDLWSDGASKVYRVSDGFLIQNYTLTERNTAIYKYRVNQSDENYISHAKVDSTFWSVADFGGKDGGMTVLLAWEDRICAVDIDREIQALHSVPEEYGFAGNNVLGLSEDAEKVYWTKKIGWDDTNWIGGNVFCSMDLKTGTVEEQAAPECPWEYPIVHDTAYREDVLYFLTTWFEDPDIERLTVCAWNLKENVLTPMYTHDLGSAMETAYQFGSFRQDAVSGEITFAVMETGSKRLKTLIRVDPESGRVDTCEVAFPLEGDSEAYNDWISGCCLWNDAGDRILFGFRENLYALDREGELMFTLPLEEEPAALRYCPDERYFLMITSSAQLLKLDARTGMLVARLDLKEYHNEVSGLDASFRWQDMGEADLLIVTGDEAFQVDVSGNQLSLRAVINHCFGYDAGADRFLLAEKGSQSTGIGSFCRYRREDLVRMAREILNIHP